MFGSVPNTPLELLTIFGKSPIFDVQLHSKYAYGIVNYFCKKLKSSHRRCSVRKGVLRNFSKFTGKHLCQSLFLIKIGLRPATLLKKRLWHRCFPVNFVKFLRTPFHRITLVDCLRRLHLRCLTGF